MMKSSNLLMNLFLVWNFVSPAAAGEIPVQANVDIDVNVNTNTKADTSCEDAIGGKPKVDQRYSHLRLRIMPQNFKYIKFESADNYVKAVHTLIGGNHRPYVLVHSDVEMSAIIPADAPVESDKEFGDWFALKIDGDMPFGTVQGLIATITGALRSKDLGACVISSYDTDYFLIRGKNRQTAITVLRDQGWDVLE